MSGRRIFLKKLPISSSVEFVFSRDFLSKCFDWFPPLVLITDLCVALQWIFFLRAMKSHLIRRIEKNESFMSFQNKIPTYFFPFFSFLLNKAYVHALKCNCIARQLNISCLILTIRQCVPLRVSNSGWISRMVERKFCKNFDPKFPVSFGSGLG